LPELPGGWCWASLDELLAESLANGRSVLTADDGFPVLRLTALKQGKIDLSERKGGAWSAREAAPFVVRKDDFLVSRGNGSLALVGRGGLVDVQPDPVAFPDTLIRIRVHDLLDRGYLARVWSSRLVRAQIERAAKTTAGIFKVSQGDLEHVAIPVPSLEEQRQVAALVDAAVDQVQKLEAILARGIVGMGSVDRAILARAFRGELVPQNAIEAAAADESAANTRAATMVRKRRKYGTGETEA
jgi:type I restriction enzyme S subunit